nr:hypothetical protein [Tanacetum cinerariifolium]
MAGEIAQQQVHVAGRRPRGQQQIAVEQRIGRLQVTNVGRTQAAGVGDLVKQRLGHALFVEQVFVVAGDQVALMQDRFLQHAQPVHGVDLRRQHQLVVGLGNEIVATGVQTAGEVFAFGQRGQEDDRHQCITRQRFDLPSGFKAVHDRHHRVHQHQLRPPPLEQAHRLGAVAGGQNIMALSADDGGQQHPVADVVIGDEDRQAIGGGRQHQAGLAMLKSLEKLDISRIFRTSLLQLVNCTSDLSPPAWSRRSRSIPSAELSR